MNNEKFWNPFTKSEIESQINEGLLEANNEKESSEKKSKEFSLVDTEEIYKEVSVNDIYSWYSSAMERRGRDPLPQEAFIRHFFENGSTDKTYAFGDKEKGFILGFNKYNVFTPTHFAPKTMRGGYDLFLSLGKSEKIPAVLAITDDLAETLRKMPCWNEVIIDKKILSQFHGEVVEKDIFYNSNPEVKQMILGLLVEYMNKSKEVETTEDNIDENFDEMDQAA